MMKPIRIMVPIFSGNSPKEIKFSMLAIRDLMYGLTVANVDWIKIFGAPPIYKAGVKYQAEKGTEDWKAIPFIMRDGHGDCEDLACWRAAELIVKGIKAKPGVKARKMADGSWRAHAIVRLPNGKIDDPSKRLGMKGID